MTDGPMTEPSGEPTLPVAEDVRPVPVADPPAPRRSLWGVLGMIVVVAVILLVLFLLRDCVRAGGGGEGDRGGKSIESVEGLEAVGGVVSVWLAPGSDLESVLEASGIESLNALDVDGERFVIEVEPGSEEAAVDALTAQEGVYDAGRVYQAVTEGDAGSNETSPTP